MVPSGIAFALFILTIAHGEAPMLYHQKLKSFQGLLLACCLVGFTAVAAATDDSSKIIRLATTTSTENSGLLNYLLPRFTETTGYKVHVIAVGTGKALRMGRDGDVDVVLVHAPPAEKKFVTEGYGEKRYPVMYNDFVILGPANDPASISKASNAADALQRIAKQQAVFVSRGDDSGTHKKEKSLWNHTQMQPAGKWYREAGQGMGKVIQIASELEGYTLADRGTWIAYQNKTSLKLLFQGDPVLQNPYGIIALNPKRYPDANHAGAQALIDWMTSKPGQALIGEYRIAGFQLFTPSAKAPGSVAASK
jgi:tungstate transport system substrate-binding protein